VSVRVGLIGAGRIAAFRAQTMADHTTVTEVVVTDPLLERAEAATADVGGSVASDATNVHAEMMLLAAEAGISVFCEKPIAIGTDQSRVFTMNVCMILPTVLATA
jgi:myo-inositol 2-dehydrogenase/D-chiro-inositol 1-dehydrogenase